MVDVKVLDKTGAAASTLCAIHCALMPVLTTLPAFGMFMFLDSEFFEWAIVGLAALIGITSMIRGHQKHHRHIASCFFLPGILTLAVTMSLVEESDGIGAKAILMALGGLLVASSHFINMHLCHKCKECHEHSD